MGALDGLMGDGMVQDTPTGHAEVVRLRIILHLPPPPKLAVRVLLALPRPKVLLRALAALSSLGVPEIVLLNAWRVDKSYWSTPKLADAELRASLLEGLTQARDTVLPRLVQARLFRRYLEDELPAFTGTEGPRLLADPGGAVPCPRALRVGSGQLATLAVGPEGGWIETELASFQRAGFTAVNLGPRVLRVETALASLIGRLF